MGEEPSLWTGFKLSFHFSFDFSEGNLFELLSLRRLQTLQYIHLHNYAVSWKTILQSLEIISDSQPPIKSLSMEVPLGSLETFDQDKAASLAEALVKFEKFEVFEGDESLLMRADGSVLLKALTAASTRGDSKLKVVTFQVGPSKFNSEDLAEARERFAVNIDEDTRSYHDSHDDYDYYLENQHDSDPYDKYDYDNFGHLI